MTENYSKTTSELRDSIISKTRCTCLNPSWWWNSVFCPFEPIAGLPESAALMGICKVCDGHANRLMGSRWLIWSQWAALDSQRLKLARAVCPLCDKVCNCADKEVAIRRRENR